MKDINRLDSVQVLRAVAALAVVAHHVFRATTVHQVPPMQSLGVPPPALVQLGAAGVDVFFVISGFLMAYISAPYFAGRRTPGDFAVQRLLRIWPPYALVTLALCALLWAGSRGHGGWPFDLQPHRLASLLFIPSFDAKGALQPVLGPGWTLNYEVLFYLCFAAVLLSGPRLAFVKLAALIGALFAVGVLSSNAVVHAFLGDPIVFEFVIGAAIGFGHAQGRFQARAPWAWLALAMALLALFERLGYGEPQRLFAYGLPAAALFIAFLAFGPQRHWPRWATRLGDASYSLYLTHVLVIYHVTSHVDWVAHHGGGRFATLAVSLLAIAVAVAVGLAFHAAVERPLVRACQRAYARRRAGALRSAPAEAGSSG